MNLERKLNILGYIISVVVLLLVLFMRKIHFSTSISFSFLPPFYSLLNLITSFTLILAYFHIKAKRIELHKKYMTIAICNSLLFLACYVIYHITTPETKYCGDGYMRTFYFVMLITHVVLAAISFPFIVFTFIRGYLMSVERHRKLAKWVFPIWLYVSLTGPICYILLFPCYGKI